MCDKKYITVTFHMHSGKSIVLDKVEDNVVVVGGNGIIQSIENFTQSDDAKNVTLLQTIDLHRVECITFTEE